MFLGDPVKQITIFGSLFTFGMVSPYEPYEAANNPTWSSYKKDAANMTFTELDIAKQDNQICKRKFNRQIQFEKHLKNVDIIRLLRFTSLTNFYHRYFLFE